MADTPTLAEQVAALRRTLHRAISSRLAQKSERPFVQLLALKVVARGELDTQAALAERLLIDPPAASRLVAQLVEDGLLTRAEGRDRRCTVLQLTAAGRRELKTLEEALDAVDARVRRALSPRQYEALLEQTTHLIRALGEDDQ